MKINIRLLYLYLFSFVGLLITVIGSIQVIDLGLKTYVFQVSEYGVYRQPAPIEGEEAISLEELQDQQRQEQQNQRRRQLSNSLAMILVGTPLYGYHWKKIGQDAK